MDLLELARRHIEAENQHDLDATMNTVAPGGAEYIVYANAQEFHTFQAVRDFYADIMWAVPDMHVEIENIIQDKERRQVFAQYKFTGTQKRPLSGLAPTNKRITYHGGILYEFDENGKLTKELQYFDKTELLASMGVIRNPNTMFGMFLLIFPQSIWLLMKSGFLALFGKNKRPGS